MSHKNKDDVIRDTKCQKWHDDYDKHALLYTTQNWKSSTELKIELEMLNDIKTSIQWIIS
jgi:hypothetical protein